MSVLLIGLAFGSVAYLVSIPMFKIWLASADDIREKKVLASLAPQ